MGRVFQVRIIELGIAAVASSTILISGAVSAQAVQNPPGSADMSTAGPKPTNVLPDILANLRKTMKDPYSIRDLRICEAKVTPAFKYPGVGDRWEPAKWTVAFELNAKNGYGAYAGRSYFSATYKGGKLEDVGSPNLGATLNAKLLTITENCPRIANTEVQSLLDN